mgnify:CR=1 FL=1
MQAVRMDGHQYRTQAHHGTDGKALYNPFDLPLVWRFEDGRSVEALPTSSKDLPWDDPRQVGLVFNGKGSELMMQESPEQPFQSSL